METKFTPGPWVPMGHRGILNIVRMDGAPNRNRYDAVPYAALGGFPDENSKEIIEANANLISAAPDLYHALEGIFSSLSDTDGLGITYSAFKKAQDALAKANGEQ